MTFDQHFKDWIPVEDARAIAAEMINGGKDQYDAQDLHQRLGWPLRRMNAALWAVQAGGLARTYSVMAGPGGLVISHLMVTPATKRAARA